MSIASSSCRIDWRPSRLLCLALATLGGLAAACVLASDLPAWARALLAPTALLHGAWLARRESRRLPCELELDAEGRVLMRRGGGEAELPSPRLRLRGRLASLDWRTGGRGEALLWFPDTLRREDRRQLLLRLGGRTPA